MSFGSPFSNTTSVRPDIFRYAACGQVFHVFSIKTSEFEYEWNYFSENSVPGNSCAIPRHHLISDDNIYLPNHPRSNLPVPLQCRPHCAHAGKLTLRNSLPVGPAPHPRPLTGPSPILPIALIGAFKCQKSRPPLRDPA